MEKKELDFILEKHKKWLNDENDGEYADLRYANLRDANLRYADLRGVDLRGADLDYSCWPLWCSSLGVHIDDRLAKQLLYHLLYNAAYSKNISEEVKNDLLEPEIVALANEFHRADECGKIEAIRKEEK